jgi:DNA invertase Pin-like site-specific DNA recombinase
MRNRDFVDRVWGYMVAQWPHLLRDISEDEARAVRQHIRHQERGERPYITPAGAAQYAERVRAVLAMFNGRNAREVARELGCGRATVYRILKQHGRRLP